jgi:hypothetical protein
MNEFPRAKDGSLTLESWDLFVIRHQKPTNLAGHFVSFLMFYGGPAFALATGSPWGWFVFFASGGVGALSHFLTGDGKVNLREATSSPLVVFYVTRLFWRVFRGTYQQDIQRANENHRRLQAIQVIPKSSS